MTATTVNTAEIDRFEKMADEWWDPTGKFRPLHKFNPVRLAYVREKVIEHFGLSQIARTPFEKLEILDIGCGGGLVSEPMARLGAKVTGIDPGQRNVEVARIHAARSGLSIDYLAATAEDIAASAKQFDVVLNMEVVEHVADVSLYLKSCAALVRPGGLMVVATINRTVRAFALAIVGAEYVLGWLPRGTHAYDKFVTPEELTSILARQGLSIAERCGVTYNPVEDRWRRSRDMGVNYMLLAAKPKV
jgi:2-polyprenyl-6-hydroxyphenyl methylase / 3-demethylubiquinone-9 3-methyltransferase